MMAFDIRDVPEEDLDAIKQILTGYRDEGIAIPLLPLNVDMDGDGIADSWGLNDADEVVLVPGVALEHTVYVSDGDDIRAEA